MSALSIYRGDTAVYTLTIRDAETGVAVDITAITLKFTAKRGSTTITKSTGSGIVHTTPASGIATLTLLPADTLSLPDKTTLEWDVQATDGTAVHTALTGSLDVLVDISS